MPHACGNPFHDIPLWLAMSLPFLVPAYIWGRNYWRAFRGRFRH